MTHAEMVEFIHKTLGVTYDGNTRALPLDSPAGTRQTLAEMLAALDLNVGVEIGVERGEYSEVLCQANPQNIKLYCVDPWKPYRGYRDHVVKEKLDEFHQITCERLKPYKAETIRKFSMEAVQDFPNASLDFVYIDGNHGFDWVMMDMIEWSKRVRSGGIVAGHDYIRRPSGHETVHVIQACQVYTYTHGIAPWWTVGGCNSEVRSFLWIKP